jgi:hypothetical protein
MSNTSFGPGAVGPMPTAGMIGGYMPMLSAQQMPMLPDNMPGAYGNPTWMDPNAVGVGMVPADPAIGGGQVYPVNGGGLVMNGNSAQYWDTLIDGMFDHPMFNRETDIDRHCRRSGYARHQL